MSKTITLQVSEDICTDIQRADVERSSRRDILIYLMAQTELNIPEERKQEYQKEYDEKFMIFETKKAEFEKNFVQPAVNNKALSWNLDYNTHKVTVVVDE